VRAPEIAVGQTALVSVDVKNSGAVAGDEVVQLYVHQRGGSDSRPRRELKGFARVTLAPGETRTVAFELSPDELRYWSTAQKRWVQEVASFDLWVGGDSTAATHAEFEVTQ
jgi:beta-glucosidase